jgi:hypothetical protein
MHLPEVGWGGIGLTIWLRIRTVGGDCKYHNESSVSKMPEISLLAAYLLASPAGLCLMVLLVTLF